MILRKLIAWLEKDRHFYISNGEKRIIAWLIIISVSWIGGMLITLVVLRIWGLLWL